METVIPNEITFKEADFRNRVTKLRGQIREEIQVGIEQVKANQIAESEFDQVSKRLVNDFDFKRKEILQERQGLIDETLLAYDRKLAATQGEDLHTIKMFREGLDEMVDLGRKDKSDLIRHYQTSLKIGDELALRCAAVAGLQLGIDEVVSDFAARDKTFLETALERKSFEARYKSKEARFYDLMGDYRSIEMPKIKRTPIKIAQTAEGKPYFKNRLELKK
jgi:hypothetical protein